MSIIFLSQTQIWTPDIRPFNSLESLGRPMSMNSKAEVVYNGMVYASQLTRLTISCPLDMRYYPYDEHECRLRLGNWEFRRSELYYSDVRVQATPYGFIGNSELNITKLDVSMHTKAHFNQRPSAQLNCFQAQCVIYHT